MLPSFGPITAAAALALMVSPPHLLLHHRAPLLSSPLDAIVSFSATGARSHLLRRRRNRSCGTRVYGSFSENGPVEREETRKFEVDRDKALEALQQLDQQIESLTQQEALPKKERPPPYPLGPNLDRDLITGRWTKEMPEISGSFLAFTAVSLVLLTILNNVLFNVFIKPSVDGNEQVSKLERVPLIDPMERLPQLAD